MTAGDGSRVMTRRQYMELRHRYRAAKRFDARATTVNASEWRRGLRPDTAGPIRASVPADVAATLDKPSPPAPLIGEQLRQALARHHGRLARAENANRKLLLIAAVMAESRALNKHRREG